ncbi:MAG: alanine racemase [Candidatus Falkowbacteria bacterium]
MIDFFRKLIKPKYWPLNEIQIIKRNILENFAYLQSIQKDATIFPVLKSNAYGHGLKELCQILNESSAKAVIVDSFPEAQIAYKNFRKKVIILNEMPLQAYGYCRLDRSEFCVYNLATIKHLADKYPGAFIHLFVNTGMNREGIGNFKEFMGQAKKHLNKLNVVGLCSHLASAEISSDLNDKQLNNFLNYLEILNNSGFHPKIVHLGNSAGIFTINNPKINAYRAGIALYGYNMFSPEHPAYKAASGLKPALRLLSTVSATQDLKPGDSASYNESYIATKATKIATIPFGYYEGLDRRLSSLGEFKIMNNKPFFAKIAGRVCMNLTCLDCQDNDVAIGDRVELISLDNSAPNSVNNLAKLENTISYEILTDLQSNIHREII